MFSNILGALQGPSVEAADDTEQAVKDTAKEAPTNAQPESNFSFWGVASAIADTVKQTTGDITASVGETDWRAEIEAFRKGIADDASTVQQQAQTVAREGAARLENLPHQAARAKFPPMDPSKMKSQLDQVGSTLGQFGNKMFASSKELVDHVTEAIHRELDGLEAHINKPQPPAKSRSLKTESGRYNRLEADISAMQRSSSTYCDEPPDTQSYTTWLETFDLGSKKHDIEVVIQENAFMAELQSRIVPLIVQYDTFWTRYFYQLQKIMKKHEQMKQVVQRAQSKTPAEDLSWDDADEAKTPRKLDTTSGNSADMMVEGRLKPSTKAEAAETAGKGLAKITSLHEEEAETSTASDDSGGQAPWTVVSSPSHKRHTSDEAQSRPMLSPQLSGKSEGLSQEQPAAAKQGAEQLKHKAEDVVAEGSGGKKYEAPPPTAARESERDDESDIDISDAELDENVDDNSDVEEDWGLWD